MESSVPVNRNKKRITAIAVASILAVSLVLGLAIGIPLSKDNVTAQARAQQILNKYPLIDGHNDIPYMIRNNFKNQFIKFDFNDIRKYIPSTAVSHTDLTRAKQGYLGAQFWAAYASCDSNAKDAARIHLEQVDVVKRLANKYSDQMKFATTAKDIEDAFKEKKIASLIGLESGHAIDSSLGLLRVFYYLGVRYMTLTHNCDVPWATNNLVDRLANASSYGGLTKFGRRVVQEMNRIGMMVDISHVSYQTMIDALDESKAPVIFSHSSVHAICNSTRNVRDDVLYKLRDNKGIIMINFYNDFVNCVNKTNETNVDNVVRHFEYVKNLIGVENLGIGADYDGVNLTPVGLEDVSKYPNLVTALLDKKWTEEEISKVLGGNLIRVFKEVEKYAESMRGKMEPIDDVISQDELPANFKLCRTSF